MDPKQKAIIEALLMQQGQMSPEQQYGMAMGNDAMAPTAANLARQRAMAGNATAQEPFDSREASPVDSLSPYLQNVFNSVDPEEQAALLGQLAASPGADPRNVFEGHLGGLSATSPAARQVGPPDRKTRGNMPQSQPNDFMSILNSLPPDQRYMLMGDDGGPDKYMAQQLMSGQDPSQVFGLNAPPAYVQAFNDLEPGLKSAILAEINAGASVDQAFNVVLGVDMNAITRGQ